MDNAVAPVLPVVPVTIIETHLDIFVHPPTVTFTAKSPEAPGVKDCPFSLGIGANLSLQSTHSYLSAEAWFEVILLPLTVVLVSTFSIERFVVITLSQPTTFGI